MPVVPRLPAVVTAVTSAWPPAYHARMAATTAQTLRGALAGAVAAGVWAAQQPLDKAVFGVDYDDVELLGKFVTRGPAWAPVGIAMHIANGAAFGAAYANLAPRLPLPWWPRGPPAAVDEHLSFWQVAGLVASAPPARGDLPRLIASVRAFAQ